MSQDPKTNKRKLTPFLAHEMLYDYVTGHLDAERRVAIEEFIKTDRESQNLIDAIKRGIAYSQSLREIQLSAAALAELEQAENLVSISKRLARWSSWPDSLRWSIIAVAISACTAGIMVLIPWKSIPLFSPGALRDENTVEIARIDAKRGNQNDANLVGGAQADLADESEADSNATGDQSGDEEFAEESSGQVRVPPAGQPEPLKVSPPSTPPPIAVAVAKPSSGTAPVIPKPVTAVAVPTPATATQPTAAARGRGFVYRAFMTLSDLETAAPKITQQVKELGAEKAGEVELGWKRGTGRYYHFTMPEANEQKLLEALRAYGPVRISKDPHPRQMPEGEVRFILWIESGA
ncbi:MAG: hypothetical protein JNJ49_01670 [Bdellovibrionaceae bacterium]|nr:hypothetical protein [Pseudobdellovibrionaceae bacterium]